MEKIKIYLPKDNIACLLLGLCAGLIAGTVIGSFLASDQALELNLLSRNGSGNKNNDLSAKSGKGKKKKGRTKLGK